MRHPVYLVPHLPAADGPPRPGRPWTSCAARFGADAVPVAGVNARRPVPPCSVATDGDGGVGALMVLAGGHTDALALGRRTRPGPAVWRSSPRICPSTGPISAWRPPRRARHRQLLALLQGRRPPPVVRTAAGALGLSQAADRIVLWAEELPVPGGGKE